MFYAKDGPAVLKSIHDIVVDRAKDYKTLTGKKLGEQAISEIMDKPNHPIDIIGTRHGEKLYESLLSREEMAKAENMENYYRVPMDARDLNYNKFFDEGMTQTSSLDDYTSHNTTRLSVPEVVELLKKLPYIENALND